MFRQDKATQMAARFLTLAGGRLPCRRLMALLYAADRRMLVERGAPITYDHWLATGQDPVLASTLGLMNAPDQPSYWSDHISRDGQDAVLKADPGDDDLSRAEDGVIDGTFRELRGKAVWTTAALPEMADVDFAVQPISYADVLRASGLSAEETAGIIEKIEAQDAVYGLLGTL